MKTAAGGLERLFGRLERALSGEAFERKAGGTAEVAPADAAQVGEVLRLAAEEGVRVLPRGAALGPTLPRPGPGREVLALSTRRMRGVREHSPADLMLRVGAGTLLQDVARELVETGQWLPLDPPGGGGVTLGGAVAEGTAGPLRAGFGRLRDHLLGLGLVTGEGEFLPLGGRVVKNVAGFDLVRLAAGSRGALGVIVEVTVRLFPRPSVDRTLLWDRASPSEGIGLGRKIAAAGLPVAALEWTRGGEGSAGEGGTAAVRLLGSVSTTDSLADRIRDLAGAPDRDLEGEPSAGLWAARAGAEGQGALALRVEGLPAGGSALVEALTPLAVGAGTVQSLHLIDGGLRLSIPGPGLPEPEVLERVGGRVAGAGGRLRLLRAPEGWSSPAAEAPPPATGAEARLRARLVGAFDPRGLLPGTWREGWR